MKINVVLSLLKKEFLNIIRDRKSLIIMIFLPLLLFPMMIGLMGIVVSTVTKVDDTVKFGINYEANEDFKKFVSSYSDKYKIEMVYDTEDNLKEQFDQDKLKTYVIKDGNKYEIHYDENSTSNISSSIVVENLYYDYQDHYYNNELLNRGINYDEVKSSFVIESVQESVTDMGSLVPSLIAMSLIAIISSVCFSVSIDVTTSEKEKGTLETLLSLPISKTELITSKYITVFLLSALSGFLTYLSLFVTLHFAGNILETFGVLSLHVNWSVLLIYFIAIILVALLFSGLLLSITVFAKNLKEAQNSLYPLEIFVMIISMLPMFGVKASLKYAIVPFVNIALLFNNVLSSTIDPMFVLLTLLSTLVYAALMIMIISNLYSQEEVLFDSKSMNYLKIKNGKTRTVTFTPFVSIVIAVIILLLSIYFSLMFATASKYILLAMVSITTFIVIAIASFISRLDIKESFKLNRFSLLKFYSLVPLYIGVYIVANAIINLLVNIFPNIATTYEAYSGLLSFNNIWLAILIVALLPAIFEELLFRGVVFNSFKKRYNLIIGILVSAIIFGVYHMNIVQGVFAFILGLFLAYSYHKTNSLFVPIIFHFINNFIATLMSFYDNLNINFSGKTYILIVIIGIFLITMYFIPRKSQK